MRQKIFILAGAAVWAIVLIFFLERIYQEKVTGKQPLRFNHKVHAGLNIDCAACHVGANDAARATIPPLQACMLCHLRQSSHREIQLVQEFARRGKEIPWKTFYRLPPHARFSHERHVTFTHIDCKICHGEVAEMEAPFSDAVVPMKMENCLSCHRKEKVSTDCLACHR